MKQLVTAKFKYNNNTPRKVRLVADLIRRKSAMEALDILKFTHKAASHDVLKVLNSAISNAVHNSGWKKEELLVEKVLVDVAPTFKRGRAAARGKYHRVFKRNCHIEISVTRISPDNEDIKSEKISKVKKGKKEEKKEFKVNLPKKSTKK